MMDSSAQILNWHKVVFVYMHAYYNIIFEWKDRYLKFCCGYLRSQALAHCEMTLSSLGIVRVNTDDTALAAQVVIAVIYIPFKYFTGTKAVQILMTVNLYRWWPQMA